jgi:hypothetical protein
MTRQDVRELFRNFQGKVNPDIDLGGGNLDEEELNLVQAHPTSTLSRLQLHFDGIDRYHGAGALVMTAGSIGMIISSCLLQGPLWVGLLAGALPTFLVASLVLPDHA